jgi:alcohol dehydrogenase YqhD (iron-dependent ADH family)
MSIPHWLWVNSTQVAFGVGAVKEHLPRFVKPRSRVLCTFGGGSIDANGARGDTQAALDALECSVRWEGGISANPEFDRLVEIAAVVRAEQPDLLLAVGGGSVLDGTKFISVAAKLGDGADPWQIMRGEFPGAAFPVGCVLTLPATGSEWNPFFVVSRRSARAKALASSDLTYPAFSLLDPAYTRTLPPRQLANGVFDALTHCIDQFLTGEECPLMDAYCLATVRELVDIGPAVVRPDSPLELRARLVVAASFALNLLFGLGKDPCWGIHMIGHQLTVKYDIDHGASLAIVAPPFLKSQLHVRRTLLARAAETVFGVAAGSEEEKANAFIAKLREFIALIGQPLRVSDWKGAVIAPDDVDDVTKLVIDSARGRPFGWRQLITEDVVRSILSDVIAGKTPPAADASDKSACCLLT